MLTPNSRLAISGRPGQGRERLSGAARLQVAASLDSRRIFSGAEMVSSASRASGSVGRPPALVGRLEPCAGKIDLVCPPAMETGGTNGWAANE